MMATAKQIGYLHALAAQAGMDDDTRRDFMQREAGVRSSRDLTVDQAAAIIDKLKGRAGAAAGAVAGLDSAVARKLRALWIAAYDLGLLRDRSDRALLSFLERQTKVSHTRFLNEPGQGTAAIEALKDWLRRQGKVDWPRDHRDVAASKRAVLDAQWRTLAILGAVDPDDTLGGLDRYAFKVAWKNGWQFFEPADYDKVQNALGRKLRRAFGQRERTP